MSGANIARYHKRKIGKGKCDSEYSLINKVCKGVSCISWDKNIRFKGFIYLVILLVIAWLLTDNLYHLVIS